MDTYKSSDIKIGVNDMTVNERNVCEMKRRCLVNTGDISPEIAYTGEYRLRRKERVKEMGFQLGKEKKG